MYFFPIHSLATGLADSDGNIFLPGANALDGRLPLPDAGIEEAYLPAVATRLGRPASAGTSSPFR
ncbi:hypothetical protein E4631_10775 [Hymenobacter sp. UV11]|uniref:hypothetical protein n=1 Tax=Hymenobacter sp. UV11 TaxID=1849735 RepID=UPI001061D6CB|nr:hypothetical protein [Hymenobacter sp. UV11]TDN40493.1 hypothetical protein A8B98_13775 [Hymenobacter sp. UV11]TFZ66492.1 hypothetical protein E4631_10775 [Hymenobacter sp. UV11]